MNKTTGEGLDAFTNPYNSDRELTSYNFTANGNFSLFDREHELLLGFNQTTEKISRLSWKSPKVDVGNFFEWPIAYPGYSNVINSDWGWENIQNGAYLSSRWSITDPLTLLLGTRLSSWDSNEWEIGEDDTGYKHSNILTPYAGLVYDLTNNLSFYASYTEIFSPQNEKDRHGDFLDPEEGINIEAGIKGEFFNGKLNSSLALFQVKKENVAKEDIMVDEEWRYQGLEGVNVKGFEVELNGEVFTNLNINAGYTFSDAEERDDEELMVKSMTTEPDHMLRINGNYQFSGALEDVTIGAAIRWQSEMYSEDVGPNDEDAVQNAFTVTDMMASYQITEEISAKININNLFDKKYYSSVPYYNAAFYGAPRNVMLSVSAQF
jgi:outer membrane receptor for ferric coprogen and ferric-rhodotorulic acid